jgi:Flp pilus assembly protein TadG
VGFQPTSVLRARIVGLALRYRTSTIAPSPVTNHPAQSVRARHRFSFGRRSSSGQGLVEFSLVFPIFMTMFMATIEFALAFNAVLNVNFGSRNAALLAAEAGSAEGADCVILQSVEDDVRAPSADPAISSVDIYWSTPEGDAKPGFVNHYIRSGSTTCTYPDDSVLVVPYTAALIGYADTTRCNTLKGCGSGHPGLDTVGVTITYQHTWRTPISTLIGAVGPGFTIVRSNTMRMEPVL